MDTTGITAIPGQWAQWARRNPNWCIVGVTVLALGLRIWGLGFGLPYLHDPDEPNKVVMAQRVFKTGDLEPDYLKKPSLIIYLNAVSYIPYYLTGRLAGAFSKPSDIVEPVLLGMGVGKTAMPTTFLLGRALTVVFSCGTVVLIFYIGKEVSGGPLVGPLASLLMAVSPASVRVAHLIRTDTFLVFFMLLSLWFSIRIVRGGNNVDYAMAGLASGLAASSKYNGGLSLLLPVTAHLIRYEWRGLLRGDLYLAGAMSVVGFFGTTPFALLKPEQFLADLLHVGRHYSTGHVGMEGTPLRWYLRYMTTAEGPATLLAALGIARSIRSERRLILLLSVFPLVYLLFVGRFMVRNAQTLLPALPFLFLLGSMAIDNLIGPQSVLSARGRRDARVVPTLLVVASLAIPLANTISGNVELTDPDGRTPSREWIKSNLAPTSRVAIESYAPFVDPQRYSVTALTQMIDQRPEWYISQGFQYLVFSEGMYGRFFADPDRYSLQVEAYNELFRTFELVAEFADDKCSVKIYRIPAREGEEGGIWAPPKTLVASAAARAPVTVSPASILAGIKGC